MISRSLEVIIFAVDVSTLDCAVGAMLHGLSLFSMPSCEGIDLIEVDFTRYMGGLGTRTLHCHRSAADPTTVAGALAQGYHVFVVHASISQHNPFRYTAGDTGSPDSTWFVAVLIAPMPFDPGPDARQDVFVTAFDQ